MLDSIFREDCVNGLKHVPGNLIDLIITSPPYNIDLGNNKYKKKGYDTYNDNLPYNIYLENQKLLLVELYRVCKEDGRLCWNTGDAKNGSIPTHSDIIQIAKSVGWNVFSIITWDKMNTSNRAAFGSFMSCSCPSFPRSFEYILIFYKKSKKHFGNKEDITITREEFVKYTNGYWRVPGQNDKSILKVHPASFPDEIPERLIKMLSYKNDIVLDPYCGIGTTCKIAKLLNRHYIGYEISEKYCDFAKKEFNLNIS